MKAKLFVTLLSIAAMMVGQTARAGQTWSVTYEGNVFTITRSVTTEAETVKYRTISLSAMVDVNFSATEGDLTYEAGEASKTVTVYESTPQLRSVLYYYQTGKSRSYRFELLNEAGTSVLTYRDREIEYDEGYKVVSDKLFKNVELTLYDEMTIDDIDFFDQTYYEIPIKNYFSATAPQEYMDAAGLKLGMTFDFMAREIEDGYQYVQVLVDETKYCDRSNKHGDVGELKEAQFLAGFGHDPGRKNTNFAKYTFPVPGGDIELGAYDNLWTDVGNTVGRLYSQKIRPGYHHEKTGCVLADANLGTLGVRFDADGKHDDKWVVKFFSTHIQVFDDINPKVSGDVKLSSGPYTEGSVFYVSVPFSEIVLIPSNSTPKITTNWGELSYIAGSGTNVLTFRGKISAGIDPTEELTITGLSGGPVRDMQGNPFTGQENSIGVTFPVQAIPNVWSGSGIEVDPYIISGSSGLNLLAQLVSLGIDFGADDTHPDGYFFKLSDDIIYVDNNKTNFTAIGSPSAPFRGHFDGDGKTVGNIYIKSNSSYQGLFGYVEGGSVKNVILEDCTIILQGTADYLAGIVGSCVGGSISDCFVYNTTIDCNGTNFGPIVGNNGATLERTYYRDCTLKGQAGQSNVYALSLGEDITASTPNVSYESINYYVQFALVQLSAPLGKDFTTITVTKTNGGDDVTADLLRGTTIVMPDYDITVSATFTDLWGIASGNDGSEEHPYVISNAAGWNLLIARMNDGMNFSGTFFQLSDDFDNSAEPITTMAGNANHVFKGNLQGNGRTLTINLTEDEGNALFYKLEEATIKNFRVAGTITTEEQYAAGIASRMKNSTLEGCVSSVTIISSVDGDGSHGGLVGVNENTVGSTLRGCVFDGVICCTAENLTHSCGGLVAWSYKTSMDDFLIRDCLYAPAATPDGKYPLNTQNCCTYYRGDGDNASEGFNVYDCYWTESLGSTQRNDQSKAYPLDTRPANVYEEVKTDYGLTKTRDIFCIEYNGKYYVHPQNSSIEEDGSSTLHVKDGGFYSINLMKRIFYRDGRWQTLCVPFAYSAEQLAADPDLAGIDIRTLSSASFQDGTLTLNFTEEGAITNIEAGVPYLIRWTNGGLRQNPYFSPVIIDFSQHDVTCDLGGGKSVTFVGTRASKTFEEEDKSVLYLSYHNRLYYPLAGTTINAQRAYFQLTGIEASSPSQGGVKEFILNFGEEDATSLSEELRVKSEEFDAATGWYTLDGRKLEKKPTDKGIYIVNGKKVLK